jgi:nucleoredoxin
MNINSRALNLILFHTRTLHRKHRCPPCRSFTPLLTDFYNANKDDLEIIFVSSDRDEDSFSQYFGKMPWLASVPGYSGADANARQRKMAEMFKIQVCMVSTDVDVVSMQGL